MSGIDGEYGEIGRGRWNDSSSPESSPRLAKIRSFSPTSDDGDLVVPPIADDDTPPPAERPLLRQPVGFAWASSMPLAAAPTPKTYQASLQPTTSTEIHFLPGQEPTRPASSQPRKKRKKSTGPARKKTNDYGGQTSRFRLAPYDPSRTLDPSVLPAQSDPPTSREFSNIPAHAPVPTLAPPFRGDNSVASFLAIPSETVAGSSFGLEASKRQATQANKATLSVAKRRPADQSQSQESSKSLTYINRHSSPTISGVSDDPVHDPVPNYYRRNYENDRAFYKAESIPAPTSPAVQQYSTSSINGGPGASRSTSRSLVRHGSSAYRAYEGGTKVEPKRYKGPLSILTLLIHDIRSGEDDCQLAELKLPLKPAAEPSDGFWVDAKVLCQQLQSSAARIDGPAKVYTLRGKFRQFFLRVTAENVDEFTSTNLAVKPDRMLDVVVEVLLPPGQLPRAPEIPRDLIQGTTTESSSQSSSPDRDIPMRQRELERVHRKIQELSRQQEREPSESPPPSIRRGRKRKNKQKHKRSSESRSNSGEPEELPPVITNHEAFERHEYRSPERSDHPDEVDKLITAAVDQFLLVDEQHGDFFMAKALPARASSVVAQYKIVKRFLDEWVGQRAPFRTFYAQIQAHHVLQALKINDSDFGRACIETLRLLELYGPNGRHYEDATVVEMLKDTKPLEYNAKPIKRLLHYMQDVDKKWNEEHSVTSIISGHSGS